MGDVVVIAVGEIPDLDELLPLYDSVGWTAYTAQPQTLATAISGSSLVVTARVNGELVGLARALSDDASICYLQDVLVAPAQQRAGVGRRLVEQVLRRYDSVRQKVLMTDNEPSQRAFYEALGYQEIRDFGEGTLRAFVQFASG